MSGPALDRDARRVQRHFHDRASQFDAIYTGRKSSLGRFLDKRLRWDMMERLRLTLEACQPVEGKSILDVGCGTGRYCFPLVQQGATKVVGVDFAEGMIAEARRLAKEKNLNENLTFRCADILDFPTDEKFDIVIAVGVFDYIKDGRRIMHKLRTLTRGKAVMTFPRADTWRAPLRKIRLAVMGCPVYFYDKKRIRDHLMIAGFTVEKLQPVGKIYFVEAN